MSEIRCFIRIHAGPCHCPGSYLPAFRLRTYGFNRVPVHVATWAFVVDEMVLKHVSSPPLPRVLKFYLVIIIQLVPDANSFIADAICLISALDSVVK